MKYTKNHRTDYQSSFFIGAIMLFVGVGGLVIDGNNSVLTVINIGGAIILFAQAYIGYKKSKDF